MRVTNEMMYTTVLNQIQKNTDRLLHTQEVMASQKKINRVSDDPLSALRVFNLRHTVRSIDQYRHVVESCPPDKTTNAFSITVIRARYVGSE